MGFFDMFKGKSFNEVLEEYKNTPGAVLIDVRTKEEYKGKKVPGSVNLPLDQLDQITKIVKSKDTPIFVYCQSGGRSGMAKSQLESKGYTHVTNVGGIMNYKD